MRVETPRAATEGILREKEDVLCDELLDIRGRGAVEGDDDSASAATQCLPSLLRPSREVSGGCKDMSVDDL